MFPCVNNKSWRCGVTASWVTDPVDKKGSLKNNCLVKEVNPLPRVIHKIYSLVVCLERKMDSVACLEVDGGLPLFCECLKSK